MPPFNFDFSYDSGFLLALLTLAWIIISSILRQPYIRSLREKHGLVTGGSSGIGLEVAKEMLKEGAYVTLVSRNKEKLREARQKLMKEVEGCGEHQIRYEVADVGDADAIGEALRRAHTWRPIDVVVCNAGRVDSGRAYLGDDLPSAASDTISTNLLGVVNTLHAALPLLKRRSLQGHRSSVIIMASLASLFNMYGHSVYTATKYGVRGLAEGLRFELLPYNIKVGLICPFFTNTPFLEEADKDEEIYEVQKYVNLYRRGYAQKPCDVARSTIKAIKSGTFLMTTTLLGSILGILTRGFVPADNWVDNIIELLLLVPTRLVSFIAIPLLKFVVVKKTNTSSSKFGYEK